MRYVFQSYTMSLQFNYSYKSLLSVLINSKNLISLLILFKMSSKFYFIQSHRYLSKTLYTFSTYYSRFYLINKTINKIKFIDSVTFYSLSNNPKTIDTLFLLHNIRLSLYLFNKNYLFSLLLYISNFFIKTYSIE